MTSSFVFSTPPLFCTFLCWTSVGFWLNWMITSTVAPLWPPLRTSRSLDSLCFLPSAKDSPATSRVTRASKASRAPQVVVFNRLSPFVVGLLWLAPCILNSPKKQGRWRSGERYLDSEWNKFQAQGRGGRWYRGGGLLVRR